MLHRGFMGAVIVTSLLLSPIIAWSAAGTSVEYSSGRISIVAEDATLSSVAERLSKIAGVTVYLDRAEQTRKVSVDVRSVSLDKAMKALVHPLNFAIVADRGGTVTELRIFRNAGLKESEYRVFAGERTTEARAAAPAPSSVQTLTAISPAPSVSRPQGPSQPSAQAQVVTSKKQQRISLAGPSPLVTGEKAFQQAIWVTNRMMEAEQVRQSMQVKADQAETQARDAASLTHMVQTSNANLQPQNAPQAQPATTTQAAQVSQQVSVQAYQQYSSQQRGFNYNAYYQQQSMRDNYSYYSTYRGR